MQMKKINALTGARFLAIMVIVFSHFEFLSNYSFGEIYSTYFHNATMGVDFFFMLSGFGMMLSSIKMNPQGSEKTPGVRGLIDYAVKHIKKIYPLYVTMLLIGIPFYMLDSVIDRGKTVFVTVIKAIIHFSYSLTLLQSATGMTRCSHALNGVCWFLSSLFCIYLVSPIVMKYLKRVIRTKWAAIIVLVLSILCSYESAILFEYIERNTIFDSLLYSSPYRRIFYVICGMAVAQLYTLCDRRKDSSVLEYVSLGASVIWFLVRNTVSNRIGMSIYMIDMVLCACVLYALALEKGVISRVLAGKTMVYLGNISVYIFLTHYLIRMYIDFIVRHLKLQSGFTAFVEVIVILLLTFAVSMQVDRRHRLKKAAER